MELLIIAAQAALLIVVSPLVSGCIRKIKNSLRMRRGQGVLQPYYDLAKLFAKDEIIPENSSWLFRAAPSVVFGSSAAALFIVPSLVPGLAWVFMGDLLVLIFLMALGRWFAALAGLDTGSAFGGMGSSREMFVSSLAEPVAVLAILAAALTGDSTTAAGIAGAHGIRLSSVLAAGALFLVALAETSRIPVDNQETHLELTMIHEAMVLEYSGASLGLIQASSHIRQIVWFSLTAAVLPGTSAAWPAAAGIYLLKVAGIAVAVAITETGVAKMRLLRVPEFLSFAFIVAGLALVSSVVGI